MLEAAVQLSQSVLSEVPLPEGISFRGDNLIARRGAGLVIIHRPHHWAVSLTELLGDGFAAVMLGADTPIQSLGRAVVHLEATKNAAKLLRYGLTTRTARELLQVAPRRRIAIDTTAAQRLSPAYGSRQARPGRVREAAEIRA